MAGKDAEPRRPILAFGGLLILLSLLVHHAGAQCPPGGACGPGAGFSGSEYCPDGPAARQCPGTTLYWTGECSAWRKFCNFTPHYLPGAIPVHGAVPATWYASVEFLPLFRDANRELDFQSLGPGPGDIILSTSTFDGDFAAGAKVVLGAALGPEHRLEVAWFGGYAWEDLAVVNNNDTNSLGTVGNLFSRYSNFGNPAVVGLDYNNQALIEFDSQLNSGEINLRHRLLMPPGPFEANVLIGGRMLQIREGFAYSTLSNEPNTGVPTENNLTTRANNDLFGVQLGCQGQWLCTNCIWVDFDAKGALCNNSAEQSTVYVVTDSGGTNPFTGSRSEDVTSFVGEVAVALNCQMSRSLTFRAGYQALWVTGVALADVNAAQDLSGLTIGPALLDHTGQVVYHGPNVGVVWTR